MKTREHGATAVEYALMVGLVAIGIIGSVTFLQGKVGTSLNTVGGAMTTTWKAEYFANATLTGPAQTRTEPTLPYYKNGCGYSGPPQWPFGLTGPLSARWTGDVEMSAGSHTIQTYADDQSRVWVDNVLVIDDFGLGHSKQLRSGTVTVTQGSHRVVMEFADLNSCSWAELIIN